jgi:hypothetical protein
MNVYYTGPAVFDNQGTLTVATGAGAAAFGGEFTNSGALTIENGLLLCHSTYTQTAGGKLESFVAGVDPSSIGRLQASSATLNGELAVKITGAYAPQLGDTFSVVTYSSRTGTFATITGKDLGGGLALQESYGASALSFQVVSM